MNDYNKEYFDNYLSTGKFTGRKKGEKVPTYSFWLNFLRKRIPAGSRILEVGCGLGFFGSRANRFFDYHGIDISSDAIKFAREELNLKNVDVGDANKLKFDDESFSAVIAIDIIEHLESPSLFLKEAHRILNKDGYFSATTPNPESLGNKIKNPDNGLIPSMYLDKTHVSLLNSEAWNNLLLEAGFERIEIGTDSLWDLPYSRTIPLFLQKITLIPINYLFQRWIGYYRWKIGENIVIVASKKR